MQEFLGRVIKKPFAVGSKSKHDAVMLETEQGEFVLRRQGGNPFHDPVLENLVGKRIRFRGRSAGYALVVNDWDEVPEDS